MEENKAENKSETKVEINQEVETNDLTETFEMSLNQRDDGLLPYMEAYLCGFKLQTQCIVLSGLYLREIPDLSRFTNLKCLFITHNKIKKINLSHLPLSLKYLNCSYNRIEEMDEFPPNLEKFICVNQSNSTYKLKKLPEQFPLSLKAINIMNSELDSFPSNTEALKSYYGEEKFCPEHLKNKYNLKLKQKS